MTTVFKLGGSLLGLPDLVDRLRAVLARSADPRPLLIVGGGAAADLVRKWDQAHHLGDERAHWLALHAMYFNEALLLELLPEAHSAVDRSEAERSWELGQIPILRAVEFLRREEASEGSSLPHNWSVTSDSVAAWVARRLCADRLVLLKSVPAPVEGGARSLPTGCLDVDPYFHRVAAGLPNLVWINLRDPSPQLTPIDVSES